MSRLLDIYKKTIVGELMSKLDIKNIHEVPKINKIVINMGLGEAKDDSKVVDKAIDDLTLIAGQRAIKTTAKKATTAQKTKKTKTTKKTS